nr:zinc finger, CCHC-type, retrotransposon Gag domain protein [Tanacetum cinerariifolium]
YFPYSEKERLLTLQEILKSSMIGQRIKETTRGTGTAIVYDHQKHHHRGLIRELMIKRIVKNKATVADMATGIDMKLTDGVVIDRAVTNIVMVVTDTENVVRRRGVSKISRFGANIILILTGHQAKADTRIITHVLHVTFMGNFILERRVTRLLVLSLNVERLEIWLKIVRKGAYGCILGSCRLVTTLTGRITDEIRQNKYNRNNGNRRNSGRGNPRGSGNDGDAQPTNIHVWLERFRKEKPQTFSSSSTPVEEENWISHIEKIFVVLGCDDQFKARLLTLQEILKSFVIGQIIKETTRGTEMAMVYDHQKHHHKGLIRELMIEGIVTNMETVVDMATGTDMALIDGVVIDRAVTDMVMVVTDTKMVVRRRGVTKISRTTDACFECGEVGHLAKDCKKGSTSRRGKRFVHGVPFRFVCSIMHLAIYDLICKERMVHPSTGSCRLVTTLTARITDEICQNENNGNNGNRRNSRHGNPGGSGNDGDAQPTDIHVWLERFRKEKPQTFSSSSTPVEAENWISHIKKIFEYFPYSEKERHREEQAKHFKWGLNDFVLILNIEFTDVAQVANAARNIEIFRDRSKNKGDNKRDRDGHHMATGTYMALTDGVVIDRAVTNMVMVVTRGERVLKPRTAEPNRTDPITEIINIKEPRTKPRVQNSVRIGSVPIRNRGSRYICSPLVVTDTEMVVRRRGVTKISRFGANIIVVLTGHQARADTRIITHVPHVTFVGNFTLERRVTRLLVLALNVERLGIWLKIVRKVVRAAWEKDLVRFRLRFDFNFADEILF